MALGKMTLIVLLSPKSKPRTITLGPLTIAAMVILVFGFLCFSIFIGFSSFLKTIDRHELGELQKENSVLRSQLDALASKIKEFETAMAEHVRIEEHLRLVANLDPIDSDVWRVGIGGPDIGFASMGIGVLSDLQSLNDDIDRLLRQVKLQRHSFTEIMEQLGKQSEELRRIPSIKPVDFGYISSGFGERIDPFTNRVGWHEGVDFSARKGSKVFATADGVVKKSRYEHGYGYTVEIDHGNGIVTRYAHNAKNLVKYGQKVKRGDVIAYVGNSGRSTAPHLHYEVRVGGIPQNPLKFILPANIVVD